MADQHGQSPDYTTSLHRYSTTPQTQIKHVQSLKTSAPNSNYIQLLLSSISTEKEKEKEKGRRKGNGETEIVNTN